MGESIAWASAKSSVFGSTLLVRYTQWDAASSAVQSVTAVTRLGTGQRQRRAGGDITSAASALDSTPDKL